MNAAGNRQVTTTSRFQAWWLTTFKGYRVKMRKRLPKAGPFGRVVYQNHWLLELEQAEG